MPRVGSFALALLGRTRKLHEAFLGVAGRKSFALKRTVGMVVVVPDAARVTWSTLLD
jgi:hypothetical protein